MSYLSCQYDIKTCFGYFTEWNVYKKIKKTYSNLCNLNGA